VYYSVTETDGNMHLMIGAQNYSVGDELNSPTFDFGSGYCDVPAETGVIYAHTTDITDHLSDGIDLLELSVQRYMVSGGSSFCEDSNTGDVYVHGIKIELIP
jgi:hypothetical protein